MALVDSGYASYLRAPGRYVTTAIAGAAAAYGDTARPSTIMSPIALKADAQAEATRQAQFLAGPFGRDRHVVKGRRRDLIGKPIVVRGDRYGYTDAGITVFVVAAAENNNNTTTLTVLKRL